MEIIFASTKLIFASILFTHPLKNNNFINTSTNNFKHFSIHHLKKKKKQIALSIYRKIGLQIPSYAHAKKSVGT